MDLAYHLPAYYRQDNYLTAIVLNGLLGGTPYSLLFTNVREKASGLLRHQFAAGL